MEIASTSLENLWLAVSKTGINPRMALGLQFQTLPRNEEFLIYSAFASLWCTDAGGKSARHARVN
jgi:hypothetical protein